MIGAGPSLDEYPIDFFEDKVCIGVNWVFSVFLNVGDGIEKFDTRAFYSVHSHREAAAWIAEHIPRFLTHCFFILTPQQEGPGYDYRKYCCREYFNEDPYWIRNAFQPGNITASDATFRAMAECIMAKRNDCRYFCRGTTLHWAIEVAVVLGAKKIYVAGGEARGGYARKHGSFYSLGSPYSGGGPGDCAVWREGQRALARAFEPYGIEIEYAYWRGERLH